MITGFSEKSLNTVWSLLYAEDDLEGTCDQKKKRESLQQPRTPAQQDADRARAQANSGKDNLSSSVRSQAAKKAAETRQRCKGVTAKPTTTSKTV